MVILFIVMIYFRMSIPHCCQVLTMVFWAQQCKVQVGFQKYHFHGWILFSKKVSVHFLNKYSVLKPFKICLEIATPCIYVAVSFYDGRDKRHCLLKYQYNFKIDFLISIRLNKVYLISRYLYHAAKFRIFLRFTVMHNSLINKYHLKIWSTYICI